MIQTSSREDLGARGECAARRCNAQVWCARRRSPSVRFPRCAARDASGRRTPRAFPHASSSTTSAPRTPSIRTPPSAPQRASGTAPRRMHGGDPSWCAAPRASHGTHEQARMRTRVVVYTYRSASPRVMKKWMPLEHSFQGFSSQSMQRTVSPVRYVTLESNLDTPISAPMTFSTLTNSLRHLRPLELLRFAVSGICSLTSTLSRHSFHPTNAPSVGTIRSASRVASSRCLAPRKLAPSKFASDKFAPRKFAPSKSAPYKFAPSKFAPDKSAPYKFAPYKSRSEEHTSELQSQSNLVCRLLLEKKQHEW